MVRAITVLATFRSSRNSCIGLLVNNMRIKYIDIDFGQRKKNIQQPVVYLLSVGCSSFLCSCLLGARARTIASKSKEKKNNIESISEMIVAASCGTKNNNASLQSNN